MAYVTPDTPEVGESTKATWAQIVDANVADHEARLSYAEQAGLANGSFEVLDDGGDPVGWILNVFSGGSYHVEDADDSAPVIIHGRRALRLTATALGGYATATSDDYLPCAEGFGIDLRMFYKTSVATVPVKISVEWFDEDGNSAGADTVLLDSETGNPSTWTMFKAGYTPPPTTAHYYRVKVQGGKAAGTVGGSIYFDGMESGSYKGPIIPNPAPTDVHNITSNGTKTITIGVHGGYAQLRLAITEGVDFNVVILGWDPATSTYVKEMTYPLVDGTLLAAAGTDYVDALVSLDPAGKYKVTITNATSGDDLTTTLLYYHR